MIPARTEFLPRIFALLGEGRVQLTTQVVPLRDVEATWAHGEPSGTRVVFTV